MIQAQNNLGCIYMGGHFGGQKQWNKKQKKLAKENGLTKKKEIKKRGFSKAFLIPYLS